MKTAIVTVTIMLMGVSGYAATSSVVQVSATVGAGSGSFITIVPTSITFGTVNPSPADHRFASNILTADFFAATAPWRIEMTTDNAGDAVGLVEAGGDTMLIKVNQPNFGVGDPEVDVNWAGNAAVWRFVLDNNDPARTILTFASSVADDASTAIPFQFAIDAAGKKKTSYGSDITFDLIIE